DVGEQYRSVIFFTTPPQERQIRGFVEKLDKEKIFSKPVVTQVVKFANFYAAEDYHQDYFAKNPLQPYCLAVINPKIKKLKTRFAHLLKPE
ncbi:MAG: peptide-methionine (S)-S-oxide reductase, partial [Candidatus Doudnabacteria bacterium]|nr:peptide-methionine (S)-S-oxide reductase [Candidatus Doudnabacteria bacterium]